MTTFVTLDRWVDTILGRLNGATPEMVRTEVTNAVREFFVESTAWRADILLGVEEGVSTIDLSGAISNADTLFILRAHFKGRAMSPVEEFPWFWESSGDPTQYWSPEPAKMRMAPIPERTEEAVLRLKLALKPSGCQVPHWVEDVYFKAITDGALGRLYLHPKRPYTNPQLGALHAANFRSGIGRAKSLSKRRFTTAEHSFRYPGGWSPRI